MIGFRIGNVNVSSNNDTRKGYFGGGTDMGWSGGISIATPFFEVGYQDFTGDYYRGVENVKGTFNDDVIRENLIESGKNPNGYYHRQLPRHKNLNKASTYIRVNNGTVDYIGEAWLQNAIHKAIKDFRFEHTYKNIEVWNRPMYMPLYNYLQNGILPCFR